MDVVLTAVAAVHTDDEYRVLSVLSLGLPRSCAKRKKTVFCMHIYIYDGHAESKDSLAIKKDKQNKNRYNEALLKP